MILYQACLAAEKEFRWSGKNPDGDIIALVMDEAQARSIIRSRMEGYLQRFEADNIIMALSDTDRGKIFRKDVYPPYKMSRKTVRKPIGYWDIVEWAKEAYDSFERPNLEGDDVLGILATSDKIIKGDKIVVSLDKDMKTIPCVYHRGVGPADDIQVVNEDTADWYFMTQTLTGDVTDGYPGCPGVGAKTAKRILDDVDWLEDSGETWLEAMWKAVVAAYVKKGLTEEDALVQARCARILRNTDYDFKKKEVILWSPSNR